MPREESDSASDVKIYIDTCIIQGSKSGRNRAEDTIFLNKCKEKGWKVYSSIHTLMELFDIARERAFLNKLVWKKWVDVNTFLRERRSMSLNGSELEETAEDINDFFRATGKSIELVDINVEVWKDVKQIVETSNLHYSDALHLALARMYQCHVLVTHDEFFLKEGSRILEEAKQSGILRICDVKNVDETIVTLLQNQRKEGKVTLGVHATVEVKDAEPHA
jgi:predicted nucleic acid-binding protein